MIPPRLQIITVLMAMLFLFILLLTALDRFYWLLIFPYGFLVHQVYFARRPK